MHKICSSCVLHAPADMARRRQAAAAQSLWGASAVLPPPRPAAAAAADDDTSAPPEGIDPLKQYEHEEQERTYEAQPPPATVTAGVGGVDSVC